MKHYLHSTLLILSIMLSYGCAHDYVGLTPLASSDGFYEASIGEARLKQANCIIPEAPEFVCHAHPRIETIRAVLRGECNDPSELTPCAKALIEVEASKKGICTGGVEYIMRGISKPGLWNSFVVRCIRH